MSVPSPDPHAAPGMVVRTAKTNFLVTQLETKSAGEGNAGTSSCGSQYTVRHTQTLPSVQVWPSRSPQKKRSSPGPDLTKVSSQNNPHPPRHQNPYRRGTQSPIGNLGREDGLGRQVYRHTSRPPASSIWRERFNSQNK